MKIYKFYQNDCPPCKAMAQKLERIKSKVDFELIELNVTENPDLVQEYGLISVPVLMNESGEKLIGLKQDSVILEFINRSKTNEISNRATI
jgi:thiol-disulfide isomerase/thioredoxin